MSAPKEVRLGFRGVEFDSTDLTFRLIPEDLSAPSVRVSIEALTDILACAGLENMPWVMKHVAESFAGMQNAISAAAEDPKKRVVMGPGYIPEGDYLREVTMCAVRFDTTRDPSSPRMALLPPRKGGLFERVPESELPDPETCEDQRVLLGIERKRPEGYRVWHSPTTLRPVWLRPVPEPSK